ncbi:carbohydrate ABC transporter permease [uncultured Friedmanniella sp.]|uniref:carbohydrate ABC transporter permease n=1 Tax=uncultured Friedmanniella sp. TaxID=335381 RepID=UPI0035CB7A5F
MAKRTPRSANRSSLAGIGFVTPLAIIIVVLFLVPLGLLIVMSFSNWPLLGTPSPAGLKNYKAIASNRFFLGAIGFTLTYTAIITVLVFGISFLLVAISNAPRRGSQFYRTAFFLPYVVGTSAAALIWYAAINEQNGIANLVLEKVGLTEGPFGFLDTPGKALFTTVTLVVWKFLGFQVVVLLVGLQGVPGELYEAARMDGAGVVQRLRFITLPFLRPTLALLLILSITGSLLAFDQFQVLTQGGPDNSTVTLVFAVFKAAFQQYRLGSAAALSVVLLVALVLVNGAQLLLLRTRED